MKRKSEKLTTAKNKLKPANIRFGKRKYILRKPPSQRKRIALNLIDDLENVILVERKFFPSFNEFP